MERISRNYIEFVTKRVIAQYCKLNLDSILLNSTLSDLGTDSLTQIEIILYIEKHYHFKVIFPDRFHAKTITVKEICEYLELNL